ncbi:MAG TPA: SurA N-terminal domain-containing protein, partial [bacterium]|nr:SurA N-terminal domain-containing protein [bacterium]
MLNVLRKNSQHWLVMAIIVVVIVGLAFFFGYSSRDTASGQTWAAKVDGQTIKMGEFLTRYRNIVERYRQQFGASFDEKMLEAFNLRGR